MVYDDPAGTDLYNVESDLAARRLPQVRRTEHDPGGFAGRAEIPGRAAERRRREGMKIIFALLGILSLFAGLMLLMSATTSVHEAQAFILLLISAVLVVGAGIVGSVDAMHK